MSQFGSEYFKLSPEMLSVFDLEGNFIEINPAWEKTLGWKISDFLQSPFVNFVHPDDKEFSMNEVKKLFTIPGHSTTGFENRYRHKDGSYRWLQWSAAFIESNKQIFCIARDITCSKIGALLFDETEEVTLVGGWEIDLQTSSVFWSKMCYQIHDTNREEFSPNLENGLLFYEGETREMLVKAYADLLTTGKSFDLELPMITNKGRKTWVRVVAKSEVRNNSVIRTFGTIEDVTKKKFEKSHTELMVESGNFGTWDWDLATDQVFFNERFCSMIGRDHKTIKHELKTWDELTHPEDKIHAYKDISDYLSGATPFYRNIHRMKHSLGHWVWILDQGKITEYREGKPIRFSGTHTDITYLKELELKKIEQDKIFETIVSNIPIMITFFDEEGNVEWINPYWTEVLGWTLEDLKREGLFKSQRYVHNEDDHLEAVKFMKEAPLEWREFTVVNKSGGINHTIWTNVRLADGKMVGFGQDIGEKKMQDELIREQQAKMVSSAKLSSLGEMASGIAHEINNPLAIIKGKAYQILKNLKDSGNHIDVEYLKNEMTKIEHNSMRIVKIIKGLRTFSRHGDNDSFQKVSFKSIYDDVLELCHERFKHQGVELRASGDFSIEIVCQVTQMAQVLLNLINNAHDAVAQSTSPWVEVHIESNESAISIFVTDSGNGISEELAQKIMMPFFTTKDVGTGTGLGLSISKGILEMHGGTLFLDRFHPNTRFVIQLPVKNISCKIDSDSSSDV